MELIKLEKTLDKVDIALIQKPLDEGLNENDISKLLGMIDKTNGVVPEDIQGQNAAALGFVSEAASESLLMPFAPREITKILNDINLESENDFYILEVGNESLSIYLGY